MLPKLGRQRDAWQAALRRAWHLWTARRLYRRVEEHGREALKLRDKAVYHEQRAKHFHLKEVRIREDSKRRR
jgi:hypothetical protein